MPRFFVTVLFLSIIFSNFATHTAQAQTSTVITSIESTETRVALLKQIEELLLLITELQRRLDEMKNANANEASITNYYPDTTVQKISAQDPTQGNLGATVGIITYTDFDCPFCKQFHSTMNTVIEEYRNDEVVWTYRNFPISVLHPNATHVAAAAECVAKIEDNDSYWKFVDLLFNERETRDTVDISRLDEFALEAGADVAAFGACLENDEAQKEVNGDFQEGLDAGVSGTPASLIIYEGAVNKTVNGAQSFGTLENIIDTLIGQNK